jgi:hypothetical protein
MPNITVPAAAPGLPSFTTYSRNLFVGLACETVAQTNRHDIMTVSGDPLMKLAAAAAINKVMGALAALLNDGNANV